MTKVNMKTYYCKEKNCNNKINFKTVLYGTKRCFSCAQKNRFKNPKNHPQYGKKGKHSNGYIDGRCSKQYYCKDCKEKKINWNTALYGQGRCYSCRSKKRKHTKETKEKISKFNKGKNNKNYIDGRTLKKHFCECGEEIVWQTASYGSRLCSSCSCKGKNNPFYGKKHTQKTKRIISKIHKNKKLTKTHKKIISMANSGKKHHLFGKHHTQKTKEKISKALKGTKYTEERIIKMSLLLGGTGIPHELSEYGAEFDNVLKELVRQRDYYKCQICGCSQVENSRQLDCHHIDYNKKNNNINNLISLCRKCHMKTNYNRKYWTKYFIKKNIVSITDYKEVKT